MAANKYTLPTATNARNLVATPLDRATTANDVTAEEPKVKDALTLELPKDVATLRLENSKFLDELSQMNRPIDRMQNLTSSCSQKMQRAVNNMNPISEYAQSASVRISQNIQQAIRLSTNISSSTVIRQIDADIAARRLKTRSFAPMATSYTEKMMSVPSTLNQIESNAVAATKNAVLSSCNSAMSFASSAINLVGSILNFIMSLIGGICASAFQMERTCLAKMDTRPPEVISVAEKVLNGMASIKPPTQTEWPTKKVAAELKSLIGLVSKFNGNAGSSGGSALSGLTSLGSQCAGMVNTCMGMARQVDALFGRGTCCATSSYQRLCSGSSLGDIGNVSDYLKRNYQQLASPVSVTISLPKINSAGFTGAISRGDGLVNLGNNQQATSANIVDPTVASGRVGNITGTSGDPTINGSGSSGSGSGSGSSSNASVPEATVSNGSITNAVVGAGTITLPEGSSISSGTLTDPNGQVLNRTVWGNISSGNIGDSFSGNATSSTGNSGSVGNGSNTTSVPFNSPVVKDLYGGEIQDGKIENAVMSILGLEEEPINLTGCTVTVHNKNLDQDDSDDPDRLPVANTVIVDENNNVLKITPDEIEYNGVVSPFTPDINVILVSGTVINIYVTNIYIDASNNGDCGSRVITGVETQVISSNPIQHTVQQQVQTNRQGIVLETVMNGDDSKKAADSAKDEIVNAALEETLNPELQYLVDVLTQEANPDLLAIKETADELAKEIETRYEDTLATLETKDPDPFANVIKNILDQTRELSTLVDVVLEDVRDIEQNLVPNTNKIITTNMNKMLESIDDVKNEVDDNIDDQLKDVDIIFKALDREAQLIDQIQPNVSDKTKDDSCTIEYRTYV